MEDCYFGVDANDKKINVFCLNCVTEKKEDTNAHWFWECSKLGYGPFSFVCCLCQHVIYQAEQKATNESET